MVDQRHQQQQRQEPEYVKPEKSVRSRKSRSRSKGRQSNTEWDERKVREQQYSPKEQQSDTF